MLFRDSMINFVPEIDGDIATSKLLSNSFFTIGLEALTGGRKAFINYTQNLLLKGIPLMFPRENIVIEILEDVEPTEEIISICRTIHKKGYTIALDDFLYSSKMHPLMELADIIKIDLKTVPKGEMKEYLKPIVRYKAKLLAEKVETYAEFKEMKALGFEYFQGYFFCKPEIIRGKDIPGSQLTLLRIMSEANKTEIDFNGIEKMIEHDIAISYKLLRYINSAFFRRTRDISSIKQALVFMGEKEIRRFVSMVAVTNLAEGKPNELIVTSCIRAKFCELVGGISNEGIDTSELFTLGLFSLIDAILDQPMKEIMKELPLTQNIRDTLVSGDGAMAKYLHLAEHYERGEWNQVFKFSSMIGPIEEQLPTLFMEACDWSYNFTNL